MISVRVLEYCTSLRKGSLLISSEGFASDGSEAQFLPSERVDESQRGQEDGNNAVKLLRACGGCLGARRR